LRGNVGAALFWGFQGFLFSICYLILLFLFKKLNKKKSDFVEYDNRGLSGLFSCCFNIIATISNFCEATRRPNIYGPPENVHNLYPELFLYAIGSLFLGVIIGYLIGHRKKLILNTT
jgi:hypothetical protein